MKKRVVVICPGRGTYTKDSLGTLSSARSVPHADFLARLDQLRAHLQYPTLSELDQAASFQPAVHTKGEHASPLIYACSAIDYLSLDRERLEVVAITGNSMGWYSALAMGGALPGDNAFQVIQTMGAMMKDGILGGQLIYPVMRADWTPDPERETLVRQTMARINSNPADQIYLSIRLGGYWVLGGNTTGLARALKELPKVETFPFQLVNHAAFHTPLLADVASKAMDELGLDLFQSCEVPLIDGRGQIWQPWACDVPSLHHYTFGHQVVAPYDYSRAVTVALKEFAPDHLVLLGPGTSLGGATAQILIENKWRGLKDKLDFAEMQKSAPFLLSCGIEDQRKRLVA